MTRRLTEDESDLWNRLRVTVKPLRKRAAARPAKAEASEPSPPAAKQRKPAHAPPLVPPAPSPKPKATSPPALAPLEQKTLRRLGRGLVAVDDRIDLHGMRQERAYHVLGGFLRHAQTRGYRIVLVVTGKGKTGDAAAAGEEGRGVLKQVVPAWLARDDFREFVVGFDDANRRHGGAGALYVRIRRRRTAGRPP